MSLLTRCSQCLRRGENGIDLQHLTLDSGQVEYTDSGGTGRPLLLVHGGVFADWFLPLAARPELSGRRVVRVRRAGYTKDGHAVDHMSIADHAGDCGRLLDALGMKGADIVGHSSGALICLDLARERPDLVSRLMLYEPAPGGALAAPDDAETAEQIVGRAIESARRGNVANAFDIFMSKICAPDYRAVLTAALGPAGLAHAELESAYFFDDEVAAVWQWPFGPEHAATLEQTVVLAVGGVSPPPVHDVVDRLAEWLPHSERIVIDGGDHLLPLRDPAAIARLITNDS